MSNKKKEANLLGEDTIVYKSGNGLYINLTNRCPCDCDFCVRKGQDGINGGESLWLSKEPAYDDVVGSIGGVNLRDYSEAVFCGFGEPTEGLDVLLRTAEYIKQKRPDMPTRLNTNGLSDLINGKKTAKKLAVNIDAVSISLNAPDKDGYDAVCHPVFGEKSFGAMLDFAADCKKYFKDVCFTVVDVIGEEKIAECQKLCDEMGIRLRVRTSIS